MLERKKSTVLRGLTLLLPLLLIAALLPAWPAGAATASGGLQVATEFGYGGKINDGRWNPLRVTLTSAEDLTGDLVVQVTPQNGMGESTYVRRVELPAGTAKEVVFAIPGGSYSRNTSLLRFYPGSVETGESLPFREGRAYLSGSSQYGGIVGVLASDPDTMNFLSLQQAGGQAISLVPLEADDIGDNPILLDGLDVLVLNDFAADTLSAEQSDAIRSWVERGGSLVFGGGAGYAKTSAGFEDLSPVEASGGTSSVSAAPLVPGGDGKPLASGTALTVANAAAKPDAQVRYGEEERPLIASMPVQAGEVWYAGYDLSLAPLSSWAGSSPLWGKLLRADLNTQTASGVSAAVPAFSSDYYNLSGTLDYFPSLSMPKLSGLVWMLLIYLVVVAPLLYLVLRKFDKREWAWVFIPLVAVVSSGAIYLAGSSDKTNEIAHTLSFVTLDGEGEGVRRSATALFVPSKGDYTVNFPAGTQLGLMGGGDNWMGGNTGEVSGKLGNFVREEPEGSQLRLGDMSYWSVAKFTVEEPASAETGKLNAKLAIDDKGAISGSVINETPRRMDDMGLVAGGQLYKIGTLEPGAEASLGQATQLSSGYYDLGSYLFAYPASGSDEFVRQRSLAQNIPVNSAVNRGGMEEAFLVAFSEDSENKLDVGSKKVANDRLSMYTQPVSIDVVQNGAFNLPYGYVGGSVVHTNTTQVSDDGMGRVSASPGSMTLGYTLPDLPGAAYKALDIRLPDGRPQTFSVELRNEAENRWQAIEWKSGAVSASFKNAGDYVSGDNQIQIRIRVNEWTTMALPEIKLTGAVQP
ncbi:hypothetical protein [Saccharibacillus brassicae]|uniref:Glutamine amidotransferase domain-containing protein n=1 Tax=Saccharibacillus brassicae TaxID=2583377 RepID=A0A4Y6V1B6_SACBS|nr:hypothetical protein [Saccharibacillus brassicae]QDH22401.1 hypothetical protein FFV09_17080 [Saccharibacillus brassicae]